MAGPKHRPPIESGCPDGFQYMHPAMVKNFGQWDYHDDPRPAGALSAREPSGSVPQQGGAVESTSTVMKRLAGGA